MKKGLLAILLLVSAGLQQALAVTLWDVYQDGLANDPTFKAAQQLYLATKENIPIERAALLPNLDLTGATQRQYYHDRFVDFNNRPSLRPERFYNTNNNYTLNLSQPIFNYSAWYALREADYQVRQAQANFVGAAQSLMLRVASAYFAVLQANDVLRYTIEQKKSTGEQLKQTQQQYEVGLVPITGVKEAEANYDALVAQEIAARNNLAVAVEQLRTITAKTYPSLMGTNNRLPLVPPQPADINQWVATSECQNYQLLAAIYGANAAHENIKVQEGGHMPVIDAIGSYNYNKDTSGVVNQGILDQQTISGGAQINFPIYQGGQINAQTTQAMYQYQQAISNMEFAHRGAIQDARDGFLGVISGISKVQADRQTILSSEASLEATRQGYQVGTRTILDVLIVETTLYQAQQTYSADQYAYLTNILNLKQAAGTIGPDDLAEMSDWLTTNYEIASKIAGIENYGQPLRMAADSSKQIIAKANAALDSENPAKKPATQKTTTKKPATTSKAAKTKPKTAAAPVTASDNSGSVYYGIALFDTRYKEHAQNFIDDYSLRGKATYLTTTNAQGETRYQVIYGHYKSLKAAETAIRNLSPNLKPLHPWVKAVK